MRAESILLAVAVVVAGLAGYLGYVGTAPAPPPPRAPAFAWDQAASYAYVAELWNNSLYGAGGLSDPNTTLFSAITASMAITFVYHLALDRPANVSTTGEVEVRLVTPGWSKPLDVTAGSTANRGLTGTTLALSYRLNVTGVMALAAQIESETGYAPASYAVVLAPLVLSTVEVGGLSTQLSFSPALSLNFTAQRIVPSALTSEAKGEFVLEGVGTGGPSTRPLYGDALVAVALAAALVAVVLGARLARRRSAARASDLDRQLRPYAEGISRSTTPPPGGPTIRLETLDDLARVADTLGRPVLRYAPPGPVGRPGRETWLYTIADAQTFLYVHRDPSASVRAGPRPSAPKPQPAGTPPPPRASPARGAADPAALRSFARAAERVGVDLATLPESDARRRAGEAALLEAVARARSGELFRAWERLLEAERDPRTSVRAVAAGDTSAPAEA